MNTYNVTDEVVQYINENKIPIQDIIKETGIPCYKLVKGGKKLSADELLKLCFYLNIQPEKLGKKDK